MDNLEIKKQFFLTLSERDKRHYAAVESLSIGHGGVKIISDNLGINKSTITIGKKEILSKQDFPIGRIRQEGGGRKKKPRPHN